MLAVVLGLTQRCRRPEGGGMLRYRCSQTRVVPKANAVYVLYNSLVAQDSDEYTSYALNLLVESSPCCNLLVQLHAFAQHRVSHVGVWAESAFAMCGNYLVGQCCWTGNVVFTLM